MTVSTIYVLLLFVFLNSLSRKYGKVENLTYLCSYYAFYLKLLQTWVYLL